MLGIANRQGRRSCFPFDPGSRSTLLGRTFTCCPSVGFHVGKAFIATQKLQLLRASESQLMAGHHSENCSINTAITRFSSNAADQSKDIGQARLLTTEQQNLLSAVQRVGRETHSLASRVGTIDSLNSSLFLREMDTSFNVIVAGEFNAGKSTVINALLGTKLLEMGALPTTESITFISHTNKDMNISQLELENAIVHTLDAPLLLDMTLVDTPGTNVVLAYHATRTLRVLPTADLILFVTSADRPLAESERLLLQSIQEYRKNVVIVLNKMDILELSGGNYGKEEKDKVRDFVMTHAHALLGGGATKPRVFGISARNALSAKLLGNKMNSILWQQSNFDQLETYLQQTLTRDARIQAKLLNPLGIAQQALEKCSESLQQEQEQVKVDVATLNLLEGQFQGWTREMESDLRAFRNRILQLVQNEGDRCRLLMSRATYWDMILWIKDTGKFHEDWNGTRKLNDQESLQIEVMRLVRENADDVATRSRAQGQAVIEYLGSRPASQSHSLVGSVMSASRYQDLQKSLFDPMSQTVSTMFGSVDYDGEASRVQSSLQRATILSGMAYTSGVACASGIIWLQLWESWMWITASASLTVAGFGILSYGTAFAVNEYAAMWDSRSRQLDQSLQAICGNELVRVQHKIMDGVRPYANHVETQQARVANLTTECQDILTSANALRSRINRLSKED